MDITIEGHLHVNLVKLFQEDELGIYREGMNSNNRDTFTAMCGGVEVLLLMVVMMTTMIH